jgi:sulfatase modifying factor 1
VRRLGHDGCVTLAMRFDGRLRRAGAALLAPVLIADCGGLVTPGLRITREEGGTIADEDGSVGSADGAVDAHPADTDGFVLASADGGGVNASDARSVGKSSEGGPAEEGGGQGLDADIPCAPGATRCAGQTPQECDSTGRWESSTSCVAGLTHCLDARCEAIPLSCARIARATNFDCGTGATGDCCATYGVPGGTFFRQYDGVAYGDRGHPATVSSFRLDAYEINVGRFRKFVNAVVLGWTPDPGSGKHAHLNQGRGLATAGDAGTAFETGWQVSWSSRLPSTTADWDTHLGCDANLATWTSTPASNESRPITCMDWYDAYAFCIWDVAQQGAAGFLPTAAEWNYAAAGGSEQRVYAWGNQAPGADTMLAIWGDYYGGSAASPSVYKIAPVGSAPAGNGKWGQSDLSGNVFEWNLDLAPADGTPCFDCVDTAAFDADGGRIAAVLRGGAFDTIVSDLMVSSLESSSPEVPHANVGARCARIP